MKLSVVTTLYNSALYLSEFHDRVSAVARKISEDYEIVFVNDGSPDNSLAIALELHARDTRVSVVDLARNHGQHKAILIGLAHSLGDLVFYLDCDLEIAPEVLTNFYESMNSLDVEVVYGVLEHRKGPLLTRLSGEVFYSVFNLLSTQVVPHNLTTARLMSKAYVDVLVAHQERTPILAGLFTISGFRQVPILVTKTFKGLTDYNLARKISLAVSAVVSFSNRPLIFIFYLGTLMSLISGSAAAYLVLRRILFGMYPAGWLSVIVSLWLLGGLIIFCQGILGIYLSNVFIETKQRPYGIIRRVFRHSTSQ